MMKKVALIAVVIGAAGCGKKEEEKKPETKPETKTQTGSGTGTASKAPETAQQEVVRIEGFATPESVLWDEQEQAFYVSNINGTPNDGKDDNGFISRITGRVAKDATPELKWIDGAQEDVTLSAPKGMALLGDTLYVADVTAVRMFDRKTGKPKGEVAIEGALFLNDLAAGDGVVYVSDSGLNDKFEPQPAQAIYAIKDGKATKLASGAELGAPNGLAVVDGELWVNTFGTGEIYKLKDGKREAVEKLPKGMLDGMVVRDGTWFVSSWEAKTVFIGKPGAWTAGPTIESPADFEVDGANGRIVVPLFNGNAVESHAIPKS